MTVSDVVPDARASTHAWCMVCLGVQPTFDRPLAEASRKRRPGFEGATLHCCGCQTGLLTIYVSDEAAVEPVIPLSRLGLTRGFRAAPPQAYAPAPGSATIVMGTQ